MGSGPFVCERFGSPPGSFNLYVELRTDSGSFELYAQRKSIFRQFTRDTRDQANYLFLVLFVSCPETDC